MSGVEMTPHTPHCRQGQDFLDERCRDGNNKITYVNPSMGFRTLVDQGFASEWQGVRLGLVGHSCKRPSTVRSLAASLAPISPPRTPLYIPTARPPTAGACLPACLPATAPATAPATTTRHVYVLPLPSHPPSCCPLSPLPTLLAGGTSNLPNITLEHCMRTWHLYMVGHRLTNSVTWAHRLTNSVTWAHRLTNSMTWAHRLTNCVTWAHHLTNVLAGVPAA